MTEQEGKVIVKCVLGSHIFPPYYKVSVTDSENRTIFTGYSSNCGITEFKIRDYDKYEVRVEFQEQISPKSASRWATFQPHNVYQMYFLFDPDPFMSGYNNAVFSLTDQKYAGLPISKGDLFLCRGPM